MEDQAVCHEVVVLDGFPLFVATVLRDDAFAAEEGPLGSGSRQPEVRRNLGDGCRRTGPQQHLERALALARNLPVGIARSVPGRLQRRFCHEKRMRNCSTGKGIFLQVRANFYTFRNCLSLMESTKPFYR
jgi:hypothetical protein